MKINASKMFSFLWTWTKNWWQQSQGIWIENKVYVNTFFDA